MSIAQQNEINELRRRIEALEALVRKLMEAKETLTLKRRNG